MQITFYLMTKFLNSSKILPNYNQMITILRCLLIRIDTWHKFQISITFEHHNKTPRNNVGCLRVQYVTMYTLIWQIVQQMNLNCSPYFNINCHHNNCKQGFSLSVQAVTTGLSPSEVMIAAAVMASEPLGSPLL